ncbi:permease prefix domain 1-containing protein [Kribbella sp. NPDC048915]|uniref:permease prefix domain 1-containing protein n=1 Tax=Kribbella sp. NPDC048915 TaxID=3155148 RepID=UPI0033D2B179
MPIDEYLAALSKELRGPRRRKADLLAEARDHLTDAAEAFEADGLDRHAAEQHAVADFGAVEDVAPGYRADLAVSQSRRTAILLFAALIIQPIVWRQGAWSWNSGPDDPSALNDGLQLLVRYVGTLAIAGAVLAVVAAGVGMRYPVVREHVTRVTTIFALTNASVIGAISLVMGLTSPYPNVLLAVTVVSGFVLLPLVLVAQQATRGLRLARA